MGNKSTEQNGGRKDVPYLRIQFTQNLCCDDDDYVHNLFQRFPGSIPREHGGGSRDYTTSSTVAKGIIIHHNSKSCSNYLWRCDLERSIVILLLLPWNTECFPCNKERLIVWGVSFLHKAGRQAGKRATTNCLSLFRKVEKQKLCVYVRLQSRLERRQHKP